MTKSHREIHYEGRRHYEQRGDEIQRSSREAKTEKRRDRVSRVCPLGLGACALVNESPGVEVGDFAATGGSGGSVTSSSVKTGFGAWAGGMAFTACKREPGSTGAM